MKLDKDQLWEAMTLPRARWCFNCKWKDNEHGRPPGERCAKTGHDGMGQPNGREKCSSAYQTREHCEETTGDLWEWDERNRWI